MNTGIFGEGFPYSNFHDLNMDWIIKIAKDFLDQYTHIQEIIEQGKEDIQTLTESGITQIGDLTATSLQDLEDKKDALEALLQQWYDTHSEDIANQLASALQDLNDWYTEHQGYLNQYLTDSIQEFNRQADAKAAETIASIPDDYTALSNKVTDIIDTFNYFTNTNISWTTGKYINNNGTVVDNSPYYSLSNNIPVLNGERIKVRTDGAGDSAICEFDREGNFIKGYLLDEILVDHILSLIVSNNTAYVRVSCLDTALTDFYFKHQYYKALERDQTRIQEIFNRCEIEEDTIEQWNNGFVGISNNTPDIHPDDIYLHYKQITVSTGEKYKIHVHTNPYVYAFILTNSNNTVITQSTLEEGDRTIYINITENGTLYVNTYDLSDVYYVKQIKIANLNDITDEINTIHNAITIETDTSEKWNSGFAEIVDNTVVPNTSDVYTHYKEIPVNAGNSYKIHVHTNQYLYAFILTDSNNTIIKQSTLEEGDRTIYIVISENGTLYVNTYALSNGYYVHYYSDANVNEIKNAIDGITGNVNKILILGDSQTQRTGYPDKLISDLQNNYIVNHFGMGGASSIDIAYLYNSMTLYANPFTIPAGTTPVEIVLYSDYAGLIGENTAFGIQSLEGINPCEIAGVKGEISTSYNPDYSNKKYYFTRLESGTETAVTRPAIIKTNASTIRNNILVVWLGTNDSYTATSPEELFNRISNAIGTIINRNESQKYIVMGLTSKYVYADYADVNTLLSRHFGYHFLDIADYILKYGLDDAGITPTSQDTQDIANGEMPSSLRADDVHFNSAGYNVIGDLLYKRGKTLGYWN